MSVLKLGTDNFEQEVLKNNNKVLVDFYADWCGPCKMMGKVLEDVDFDILKVNVDTHSDLAKEFGVMSIPTLILFEDGKAVKKSIGFMGKDDLEDFLK